MVSWDEVTGAIGVDKDTAEKQGAFALLSQELLKVEARLARLIDKYGVPDAGALERAVSSYEVPEHPSWEDLILWEGLEEKRQKLLKQFGAVGGASFLAVCLVSSGSSCSRRLA